MPENEPRTTSNIDSKPRSMFSDFSFRTLYLLLEKPINLFRTWYLIVYHPREYFEYFFGPQFNLRVHSNILLGVSQIDINTKHHKIMSPFWFIIGTASISIPLLTIATHIAPNPKRNGENIKNNLPDITNIQILDEFIFASLLVFLIVIYSLLSAGYIYLFCEKAVSLRRLLDFSAYCHAAMYLTLFVGLPILVLLISLSTNMMQRNGQPLEDLDFLIIAITFAIYIYLFLYMLGEVFLRLFIANQIIVLRDVLKQGSQRIALMFGIGLVIFFLIFITVQ